MTKNARIAVLVALALTLCASIATAASVIVTVDDITRLGESKPIAEASSSNAAPTVSSSLPFVPQEAINGEWTASIAKEKHGKEPWEETTTTTSTTPKLQLSFEQKPGKNGKHSMGQSFDFSELQGLTLAQVQAGGPVKFSLVREAGRIDCEGSFQDGKGSGTFRFTGNLAFVSAMKSRGFDFEKAWDDNSDSDRHRENRLFTATVLNVTTALADDLMSAGFKLDTGDLFKAAIFKIDSKFMREMKASGFPNLDMEDLVKARIFKIDAEFVKHAVDMGFKDESFENLVKMRIFKVTPEFVAEVRNEGINDTSIESIVKLRIFNIDRDFIRQARADGASLDVETLVRRKIGVGRN